MRPNSSKHLRGLTLEQLESRQLLTSDWQHASLHCDVDANNLVTPIDVLVLINSINKDGDRALPTRDPNSTAPYYDVNADGQLSFLDVLQVINTINRAQPDLGIQTVADTSANPSNNGVVFGSSYQFKGTTSPLSKVQVSVQAEGSGSPSALETTSGIDGSFSIALPLQTGINQVSVTVQDELGRSLTSSGQLRRGDLISTWNASILNGIRTLSSSAQIAQAWVESVKPPKVARNLAMIYGAMFDAMNSVQGGYHSVVTTIAPQGTTDAVAAAAAAAHRVASALYPDSTSQQIWDKTLAETLGTIPDGDAKTRGIALGVSIGNSMLQARASDGSDTVVNETFQDIPGKWKPTGPAFDVTLPQWPNVTPFVIPSGSTYRPSAPPALTSQEYADAVNQVRQLGKSDSTIRTADQTQVALFWADGTGTSTPPGHWNQIASDLMATKSTMSLLDKTRAMALLNLAMSDAGIASWDSKYFYDLWRPIDAIRGAAIDGNDQTAADTNWNPLIKTPPFPSYVSGHSTFSGAASAVLTSLFGNQLAFSSQQDSLSEWKLKTTASVSRSYTSFQDAANEAGMSRIYGGIHYSFDNATGLTMGASVGTYVLDHALKPL